MRSLLHEFAVAVEQVGAPVGGLHAVAVHVREREFAHLARGLRALGGPVPKARPEPVRHRADLQTIR